MKAFKLLAVVGLAVALVTVPALAARVTIEISGKAEAGDLFIQVDGREPVKVSITAEQPIKDVRDNIVSKLNEQQKETAKAVDDNKILINADKEIRIGEARDKLNTLAFKLGTEVKARGLTFKVISLPTLTQWGLIALAVLLAGGMGYMLYRRPALRPAAP